MASFCAIPWIDVGCSSCQGDHGDGVACTSLPDTPDPCILQNNSKELYFTSIKKEGASTHEYLYGFSQGFHRAAADDKNAKVEGNHRPTSSSATKLR